jgi:hypothetical protein
MDKLAITKSSCQNAVVSLRQTIRLMGEVDGMIDVHWRVGDQIVLIDM